MIDVKEFVENYRVWLILMNDQPQHIVIGTPAQSARVCNATREQHWLSCQGSFQDRDQYDRVVRWQAIQMEYTFFQEVSLV